MANRLSSHCENDANQIRNSEVPAIRSVAEEVLDGIVWDSEVLRLIGLDRRRKDDLLRIICLIVAKWESASSKCGGLAESYDKDGLRMKKSGEQVGAVYAAIATIVGGEGIPYRIEVDPALTQVANSQTCLGDLLRKIKDLNQKLSEGNLQVPGRHGKLVRIRDSSYQDGFAALADHLERLTHGLLNARRVLQIKSRRSGA
jgi:hypothetical protein